MRPVSPALPQPLIDVTGGLGNGEKLVERRPRALGRTCRRLRGKQPKLTGRQEAHLVALHRTGEHTSAELAELFNVARSTVYRTLERARQDAEALDAA